MPSGVYEHKKGYKKSPLLEEIKKKIGLSNKGKIPWNKNKKLSVKHIVNLQKSHKGQIPWIKGKHHTKETIQKLRLSHLGKKFSKETIEKRSAKIRNIPLSQKHKIKIGLGNKGKVRTKEVKDKLSKAKIGKCGELASNWQGGLSFEPYGIEFNYDLKEVIRNRDRRKCQICGKVELEEIKKLAVHHIDYNKKNNDPKNLIALCIKCHLRTNSNRNYWTLFFTNMLLKI